MFTRSVVLTSMLAAAALAVPAASPAAVLHFRGHATGPRPDRNMVIAFDLRASKGRPVAISNIRVRRLDYRCHFGGRVERPLRLDGRARVARSGAYSLTAKELPPAYANDLWGRFRYPKKGVRAKPTVTGYLSSEFGYGLTRTTYNCLAGEFFTATPR